MRILIKDQHGNHAAVEVGKCHYLEKEQTLRFLGMDNCTEVFIANCDKTESAKIATKLFLSGICDLTEQTAFLDEIPGEDPMIKEIVEHFNNLGFNRDLSPAKDQASEIEGNGMTRRYRK